MSVEIDLSLKIMFKVINHNFKLEQNLKVKSILFRSSVRNLISTQLRNKAGSLDSASNCIMDTDQPERQRVESALLCPFVLMTTCNLNNDNHMHV